MGMHEVLVTNEGEAVRGAPHFLRSMPKSKKDYDGMYKINDYIVLKKGEVFSQKIVKSKVKSYFCLCGKFLLNFGDF